MREKNDQGAGVTVAPEKVEPRTGMTTQEAEQELDAIIRGLAEDNQKDKT